MKKMGTSFFSQGGKAASRHRRARVAVAAAALGLAAATPVRALTIVPTYDASVTSDPRSPQIQSAFAFAAKEFERRYTDNVTVNITVSLVPGTGIFGQTQAVQFNGFTYTGLRTALIADQSTGYDAKSVASLPVVDPTSGGSFTVATAQSKALGLFPFTGQDGTILFGGGWNYTFDPNHRAEPGKLDFIGLQQF